ncbi:MAG: hypothetical protein PHI52_00880 [Bacteroidales bacterium]|nr:hypothetical protein [Bacteroidales bacterium]
MNKRIMFLEFCFFLFLLIGCYSYYTEINKNGISKFKNKKSFFIKNFSSYSSDGIYVKDVDLIFLNDTISKRCFTSTDLYLLKKVFLNDPLYAKKPFQILAYSNVDLENCLGLFYACFHSVDDRFLIYIPLLKLKDTIIMNELQKNEISCQKEEYIKQVLLEKYDTLAISEKINLFLLGKFERSRNISPAGCGLPR